jgi:hypothetical protein
MADVTRLAQMLAALAEDNPELRELLDAEDELDESEPPRIPERVTVRLCRTHLKPVEGRPDAFWCPEGHDLTATPVTQEYALPVVYPRVDGPHLVLGPEVFASSDRATISWRGRNFVSQERLRHHLAAVLGAAGLMATTEATD